MRFDLLVRDMVRTKLVRLTENTSTSEDLPRINEEENDRIKEPIQPFRHTTKRKALTIGGVDSTRDFPSLSYSDSFIHVTLAQGTRHQADRNSGLKEMAPQLEPRMFQSILDGKDVPIPGRMDLDSLLAEVAQGSLFRETELA